MMSDAYLLNRDTDESKRLGVQNRFWTASLGYHIHPRIEVNLPPDAVVADVGTGTGAWLLTIDPNNSSSPHESTRPKSRQRWTYHGFDLSSAQFPPADTLPSNVTLTAPFNLLEPVPSHFQSTFDMIHLRLLILGLNSATEFPSTIRNLCTMLKPGGWLQWDEIEVDSFLPAVHSKPPLPAASLATSTPEESGTYQLTRGFTKFLSLVFPRCENTMPALWSSMNDPRNGLDPSTVSRHIVNCDRLIENRPVAAEMGIGTFYGVSKMELAARQQRSGNESGVPNGNGDVKSDQSHWFVDGMDMGPRDWTRQQYDEQIALMRKEVAEGAYVGYRLWSCFGRKA